ncbi:MAG: hypothetical protein H7243_03070 [Sphingomonadaceae bacterium]|nr:hypothetical protein [Sphingomonadaceae bacterium]
MGWLTTSEVLPCTVEVEHSDESLHAHVALDGNPDIGPGDRVRVHGAAIRIAFGEKISVRRAATLTRAGVLLRAWTRFVGHFGMAELYEVSFTGRGL